MTFRVTGVRPAHFITGNVGRKTVAFVNVAIFSDGKPWEQINEARVVVGRKGWMVHMPSKALGDGKYCDLVVLQNHEFRQEVELEVVRKCFEKIPDVMERANAQREATA